MDFPAYRINRLILLALLSAVATCFGQHATAQTTDLSAEPSDSPKVSNGIKTSAVPCVEPEIWFVSARGVDCATTDVSALQVQRLQHGCWTPSDFQSLLLAHRSADAKETVLYVHGNRTDEYWAKSRGIQVHRNLFGNACCAGPVRFVIWAWKSDKVRGLSNDFCLKSTRAVRLGPIFAATLSAFDTKPPLVIAYSLGCQVVASAFTSSPLSQQQYQLAAIAPVLDCCYSNQCFRFGMASSAVKRVVVFSNPQDPVTKAAKKYCALKNRRQNVTFESWTCSGMCPLGLARMIDVSAPCERDHSVVRYSGMPQVRQAIQELWMTNSVH